MIEKEHPVTLSVDIRILDLYDDFLGLRVASDDEETFSFFEAQGLLGDGCTWQAVVDALVRTNMPSEHSKLEFTCESESLLIMGQDRALLERVEALVRQAVENDETILRAIADADSDLLE